MNGLRVYTDIRRPDTKSAVFYTRRAGGPYYRWRYEEFRGQWQCSRMQPGDLTVTELVAAPWKGVPGSLKSILDEHYVE